MSIDKIKKGDPETQSKDLVSSNISKLKELFPEVVTEGKIDFTALQEILGEEVESGDEYYRFTWAGKAQARREAHKPSTGTLRPCKEESVDWDSTENLYIEGDNLEVLKLLQKSYAGKVKMIYIDPPYNTGKDFVYKDNYKDNLKNYRELTGQVDGEGSKVSTNSDSDGRYHSNWLNMMYPRLRLARNLLLKDGLIFISIDNNEFDNLKKLCDEVFGEINRVEIITWKNKYGSGAATKGYIEVHEYILVYSKEPISKISCELSESERKKYIRKDEKFEFRGGYRTQPLATRSLGDRPNLVYPIPYKNTEILPDKQWVWGKERMFKAIENNDVEFSEKNGKYSINAKKYLLDENGNIRRGTPTSLWNGPFNQDGTKEIRELFDGKNPFDFVKPSNLIYQLLNIEINENTDTDYIILDFFSGSGTTAHSVFKLNANDNGSRKFIQVQIPEPVNEKSGAFKLGYSVITEIGKERISRAAKKIAEEHPEKAKDLDLGFKVFKLDTSNINAWDGSPEKLKQELFDSVSNIKTDRSEDDVLYEILLKYGLDLTLPIETKDVAGIKVYSVGYGALFICLADSITKDISEGIGAWKETLNPEVCRVVFKDSGFKSDADKSNAVQTLKRFGITEIKSI